MKDTIFSNYPIRYSSNTSNAMAMMNLMSKQPTKGLNWPRKLTTTHYHAIHHPRQENVNIACYDFLLTGKLLYIF